MENPRKGTTVATAPGDDELRVIDQRASVCLEHDLDLPQRYAPADVDGLCRNGNCARPGADDPAGGSAGDDRALPAMPTYFLNVGDFIHSLVQIPAAPVTFGKFGITPLLQNTTTATQYLAGIASMYSIDDPTAGPVGRCSASFLCFQVPSPDPSHPRTYTDIANYISLDNGLIVSWFTPTTIADLSLDSVIHGMVTECIVVASTKIGVNPFYGETFNLQVSSVPVPGGLQIQFTFTNIPA